MECWEARELIRLGGKGRSDLPAHLALCRACRAEATRETRLNEILRPVLLTTPPREVAERAVRAALAAAEPAQRPLSSPVASLQPLSLAAYALIAAIVALAVGAVGVGPVALLAFLYGGLVEPLRLVLVSPAAQLYVRPEFLSQQLGTWLAVVAAAWGLRQVVRASY